MGSVAFPPKGTKAMDLVKRKMIDVQGKTILVTGGNTGIGAVSRA